MEGAGRGAVALGTIAGPWSLLSCFFSPASWQLFPHAFCHEVFSSLRVQTMEAANHGLKPEAKINLSSLEKFPLGILSQ